MNDAELLTWEELKAKIAWAREQRDFTPTHANSEDFFTALIPPGKDPNDFLYMCQLRPNKTNTAGSLYFKSLEEIMPKYVLRKYNGDDTHSWAVFKSADLPKNHRGIVFTGDAMPLVTGCVQNEARYYRDQLNAKENAQ